MRDRVALAVAAFAAIVHLAVADRYDLFRDELYFIVCGRHPAFGYADQPPFVPLMAAGGYALGAQTWIVRLPDVLAAAALAYLAVAFVRLLGGGSLAACITGIAVTLAPELAGITATLSTTSFEPLAWTATAYFLTRFVLLDDRRAPLYAGATVGLAMEVKYAIPVWLAGLAVGLALTEQRRILARREVWLGVLIASFIAAPSLVWQASNGWPFAELVHNAHRKDSLVAPIAFALNQMLVYSPLLAPLWIGGILAPFALQSLRAVRFVAIAYAISAVAIVAGHGKDYYLAPAVPSMLVFGAVALQHVVRSARARVIYAAAALVTTLPLLPIALPILPPDRVVPYERALHLAPQQQESADVGAAFPATFADMLGWRDFAREMGTAYASIPPQQRAATAVVVENYGEAAALDLYGMPYDLPRALTGHNQYYLWGPVPDAQATNVLRVQDDVAQLRPYCTTTRVIATTHSTYARSFENGRKIAYCGGLHPALSRIWPSLKFLI